MRYFLDRDESSHWYLIPFDKFENWREWCRLFEEDESNPESWKVPEYARMINSPFHITFENPEIL